MKNQPQCQCQDGSLFSSNISYNKQMQPFKKEPVKPISSYDKTSNQYINTEEYIKQNISQEKVAYLLQIFVLMVLMTLSILLISNYDNLLQLEVIRNQKIVSSYDNSFRDSLELKYKFCPDHTTTFHVSFNQKNNNLQYDLINKQASFCRVPVLGNSHLTDFIAKWNIKFPNQFINIENIKNQDKNQDLLALLKLYFSSGTYVNVSIPYSQIDQQSWKYALTGFDIIFIDYTEKNEKEIYVPDYKKFMKVRFPYSPQIKFMIEQLINQKDLLQQCKERQCLIIKSSV